MYLNVFLMDQSDTKPSTFTAAFFNILRNGGLDIIDISTVLFVVVVFSVGVSVVLLLVLLLMLVLFCC